MKKDTNKELESRGYHQFERIGRPDVIYDARSRYNTNLESYNTAMKEKHKYGIADEITEVVTIEVE